MGPGFNFSSVIGWKWGECLSKWPQFISCSYWRCFENLTQIENGNIFSVKTSRSRKDTNPVFIDIEHCQKSTWELGIILSNFSHWNSTSNIHAPFIYQIWISLNGIKLNGTLNIKIIGCRASSEPSRYWWRWKRPEQTKRTGNV